MKAQSDGAKREKWLGLKIINTFENGETSEKDKVQFEAYYEQEFMSHTYHEIAEFEKVDGHWIYIGGEVIPQTVKRIGEKVGRNDPCPCGMPKKYKHCCGR